MILPHWSVRKSHICKGGKAAGPENKKKRDRKQ